MESSNFYKNLKEFNTFSSFTDEKYYQDLPEDWIIFISDIVGSTQAIEAGKYREVNLIGAASITRLFAKFKKFDFPFVFGGDGSSLCVPAQKVKEVELELGQLINMAKNNFDLVLRVAKIPASEIYKHSKSIKVAKFQITPGRNIALFRGGGLSFADRLAKDKYDHYKIKDVVETTKELTGVSCRWNPIPAQKDIIVSLLVMSQSSEDDSSYSELIDGIQKVLNSKIEDANPVRSTKKTYKGLIDSWNLEKSFHDTVWSFSFLIRAIEIFLSIVIFKLGINLLFFSFDSKAYAEDMATHSDFRKFDDTLRLILDCTQKQVEDLRSLLEEAYQDKKIFYGMFTSQTALMTCFVEDLKQGNHLHFVDGGDGGFAMAAKQLKSQLKLAGENS